MLHDTSFDSLVSYLRERDIGMVNASPLGMGLFTESGPSDGHPATEEIKGTCRKAVEFCRDKGEDIAKLAIQFGLQSPAFATTLAGKSRVAGIADG